MISFAESVATAAIILAAAVITVGMMRNTVASFFRRGPWHALMALFAGVVVVVLVGGVALLPAFISSGYTEVKKLPGTNLTSTTTGTGGAANVPAGG